MEKPSKILHLIGGGEIGGAEKHVLTLLEGLDHQYFLPICGCLIDGPFAALTLQKGIPTKCLPMKSAFDLTPLPKLMQVIKSEGITLIHTHGSRANLLGRLAGRWLKIPVVSTVHSSLAQDYLSPKVAALALLLDRLTLPLTSGIITVSEALAIEVAERGGRNIRTIYNGIETLTVLKEENKRQKLRESFRIEWGVNNNSIVIGCIARLHPTKGLHYLIESCKILVKKYSNLHLVIIGEGPLRSELETKLKSSGIPYTMTGFMPDGYRALPALDIFVLPSISEGMGLVLLEAMQAYLPIIATSVGGIPEIIDDGVNGLLVPPKNPDELAKAFFKIIDNPDLRKKLINGGEKSWRRFCQEEMIRQTEEFYREILSAREYR